MGHDADDVKCVDDCNSKPDDCFKDLTVPYSDLIVLERIGSGGFGTVEKVTHPQFKTLAFKQMKEDIISPVYEKRLKREARLHLELNHRNIIRLYRIVFEVDHYGLLLEYAEHGHLLQYLLSVTDVDDINHDVEREQRKAMRVDGVRLTELKLRLLHDVSVGMTYLHSRGVVHGDLKIENVLICEGPVAKVCDFGLSKWKEHSLSRSNLAEIRGSLTNIPPEMWNNPHTSKNLAYDLYGFSMLAWHALVMESPYPMGIHKLVKHYALNNIRPALNRLPKDATERCKKVIMQGWANNPEDRPKFEDVQRDLRLALTDHLCYQLESEIKLLEKIPLKNRIKGISMLNDVLFILCDNTKLVGAYSLKPPYERLEDKEFKLPSMVRPMDMTASALLNRLFISDKSENNTIWVYDVLQLRARFVRLQSSPYRLTATKDRDELIVVSERSLNVWQVETFRASNFDRLHSIDVPGDVLRPELVIRNTNKAMEENTFMMFYQTKDEFRESKFDICQINLEGEVLAKFDILQQTNPLYELDDWWPQYMAMHENGNLIMADRFNRKLWMVSSSLDAFGLIADFSEDLDCPIRVGVDGQRRLIVTAHYTQQGGLAALFSF